ncbi:hypothetical protein HII36_11345 [Nonomuraea sp. NN258]|uniref:hypothetical protein n=1 Tax=Nonomuraea antri TaxID=2730852 RepID=UPI00156A401F|nr:hypothetical protein [Nonomuraea antri]NRQ32429.1 hypothetical protein [Nonomuraea antri]
MSTATRLLVRLRVTNPSPGDMNWFLTRTALLAALAGIQEERRDPAAGRTRRRYDRAYRAALRHTDLLANPLRQQDLARAVAEMRQTWEMIHHHAGDDGALRTGGADGC